MADYIFEAQTPNGSDFDAQWHTLGVLAAVSEDADAIGGRAWFPNTTPANFLWLLYRVSDQVVVAQVDLAALAGTVNNDWNAFTSADFATPGDVALSSAEQYIPAVVTNGDFVFNDVFSYPIGPGIVTASEGRFFNGGTGATFPTEISSTDAFFADVLVEAGLVVVNLTPAVVALSAPTVDPTPGAVTVNLTPANVALSAPPIVIIQEPGLLTASEDPPSQLDTAATSPTLTPAATAATLTTG